VVRGHWSEGLLLAEGVGEPACARTADGETTDRVDKKDAHAH
jgi:hypothetical protein